MTTVQDIASSGARRPSPAVAFVASADAALLSAAATLAVAGLAFAILGAVDGREVAGESPWAKPIRFSASLSMHLATMALFWPWLASGFRDGFAGTALRRLVVAMCVFELTYIAFQASRANGSHYNVAEPFPALMYSLMGVGAVVIVLGAAVAGAAALAVREEGAAGVMRRAIGLGLLISGVLGLATGALLSTNGGHHVGVASPDGPIWPVFGWSREIGDLRIAHFIALHAAQGLPLLALAALRLAPPRGASMIVAAGALAFLAATAFAALVALSGRPVL